LDKLSRWEFQNRLKTDAINMAKKQAKNVHEKYNERLDQLYRKHFNQLCLARQFNPLIVHDKETRRFAGGWADEIEDFPVLDATVKDEGTSSNTKWAEVEISTVKDEGTSSKKVQPKSSQLPVVRQTAMRSGGGHSKTTLDLAEAIFEDVRTIVEHENADKTQQAIELMQRAISVLTTRPTSVRAQEGSDHQSPKSPAKEAVIM